MKKEENKIIFIVGNSRSGTTMLSRILNNNSKIHSFQEIHFFEKMFKTEDLNKNITYKKALKILNQLIAIQSQGFYKQDKISNYNDISDSILNRIDEKNNLTPLLIYSNFLFYWTSKNNKTIPCEQTPKNLYYLEEIKNHFPQSRIINMVRDPRSVLLSQKNKWKRKFLGEPQMPIYESLRAWSLYHPITISRLWLSATSYGEKDKNNLTVRFEDLILSPKNTAIRISNFCGIDFSDNMLMVPKVGSSISQDKLNSLGVDKRKINTWENNNISKTELYLLQKIVKKRMKNYNYKIKNIRPNYFHLLYLYLIFPLKISFALILNLGRMKNIVGTLKRRIKSD